MTWRLLAVAAAAVLVQACASAPPAPPERQPQDIAAAAPSTPVSASSRHPRSPLRLRPCSAPAGSGVLDTAKPPPFEGERQEVAEPLRGVRKVDRTVQADDLWQRMRQGFAMPDLDSDLVRKQMAYYASRPDYLQRMFDRSRIYLYHIVDELEKRNLPDRARADLDNSLLPPNLNRTVESQYGHHYYGYRNLVWQTQVQLAGPGGAPARSSSLKAPAGNAPGRSRSRRSSSTTSSR